MFRPYKPYIPKNVSEIMDQLGFMMLASPKFEDEAFPEQSVETVFHQLNEGLRSIRSELGDPRYQVLRRLSDRMRAHFEADPEDKTADAIAGRELIHEMEDLLVDRAR